MRIDIDVDQCVGAGQCVLAAAQVFDQRDDDGIVVLLQDEPHSELREAVRQAALLCPTNAIRVHE